MTQASTSKAVTKKTDASLAAYATDLMDDVPVEVEDITIPKLLLQQSQSGMFKEGKSKIGEIRGSLESNLIAKAGEEVEFIPFSMFKTWVTLKTAGGSFIEETSYATGSKEREEIRDGIEVKNYQSLNYYCLLPEDIKSGVYMPYVISFRSTSYNAGKTLETKRALLADFNKPLAFKTFKLSSKGDRNADGNDYQVLTVAESRDTTPEELEAVSRWNKIIKTKNVIVDDSDTKAPGATAGKRTAVSEDDDY